MTTLASCQDLSKSYGNNKALDQVSFEITAGDPVALVGPNGAGKTTLLSILSGFIRPSAGRVTVFEGAPGGKKTFGKLSALPQDARFDPRLTVRRQLAFYAQLQGFTGKAALHEVDRVLELVKLEQLIYEKPEALSHGMGKRAAIAQALIGTPELVLLDEPTAGLDPGNARHLRQVISNLSDQTTFIISSHNLSELEKLCHNVLFLEQGRLQPQTEQASSAQQKSYLTLLLANGSAEGLAEKLQLLKGFVSVEQKQKNEYLIKYDAQIAPMFDQLLLRCVADNGWEYRQLLKGKSLEEKLFAQS